MPCGGRKKVSPHSSIVQIIFYFWSFEIKEYILKTQKLSYVRIIFLTNFKYFGIFRRKTVFETTAMLKFSNIQYFPLAPFFQIYRVADEALIAETAVWPNFFLMNVFFALEGSKLFIIIHVCRT